MTTTADAAGPPAEAPPAPEPTTGAGVPPAAAPAQARRIVPANTHQPLSGEVTPAQRRREWSAVGFWLRWTLATLFSWTLAYAVFAAITLATGEPESMAGRAAGYAFSLLTVLLQWLVLRRRLDRAWRWLPVSLAAVAVGGVSDIAWDAVSPGLGADRGLANWAVSLLLEAVPLALAQWLLLRAVAHRAWRWLVAYAVWVVLMLPLGLLDLDIQTATAYVVVSTTMGSVAGLFLGAVTGAEMVWLLRHLKREPADDE
jgi:hypothetical protein